MKPLRLAMAAAALLLTTIAAFAAVNVAVYTLAAVQVTTAITSQAQTAIPDLDGMTAVSLEANFAYGSGGTSFSALAQTSCDGGTTWRDVARFDYTTSTAVKYANLSGLTAKGITALSTLGSEGVTDGFLCDRLRAVLSSVGTYSNTTFSLRAGVR